MMTISFRGLGALSEARPFGKLLVSLCLRLCGDKEMLGSLRKSGEWKRY